MKIIKAHSTYKKLFNCIFKIDALYNVLLTYVTHLFYAANKNIIYQL